MLNKDQEMKVTPLQILDNRQVKNGNHNINQVLVQWENLSTQDATWYDKEFMEYQFPKLILEVKDLKEYRVLSGPKFNYAFKYV